MKKATLHNYKVGIIAFVITIFMASPFIFSLAFLAYTQDKIYPNTQVSSVNLGMHKKSEAEAFLARSHPSPSPVLINLSSLNGQKEFTISPESIEYKIDYKRSVQAAFQNGRSGNVIADAKTIINTLLTKPTTPINTSFNAELLDLQLSTISNQLEEPNLPKVQKTSAGLILVPGKKGEILDKNLASASILNALKSGSSALALQTTIIDILVSPDQATLALSRAEAIKSNSITLTLDSQEIDISGNELLALINPKSGYYSEEVSKKVNSIANLLNRPPQNPVFNEVDGKVKEFSPSKDGLEIETQDLTKVILESLFSLENDNVDVLASIPAKVSPAEVQTSEANSLGIKELLGKGTSKFVGSNASRIHNINLASSRLNGVLIKPGEIFSFNRALGDISKFTGFKESFIIQSGKTVLGDGGGVCQVSTTFFRAALNSGLPIVERNTHSYRVTYYEQDSPPGLDATIYSPTVDLKIKNDTPGHILIQAKPDLKQLTLEFEFYGTKDGRVAKISKPVLSNFSPAPEPSYTDEPTLPTGTTQQVDFAAPGARASVNYSVERDGQVLFEDTFTSNYRPWQARFLVGTGPVN